MYLSALLIDVGTNPDRPRPGRLWLRNLYRVHQRLCMAFPYPETKENDPDFLKPYQPCAFHDSHPDYCSVSVEADHTRPCTLVEKPVHVPRDGQHNFQFRLDPQTGGRVVILVLSALEPDWDYAFHNAQYLLAAPPATPGPLQASFSLGAKVHFWLVANPTRKIDTKSGPDGKRRHGRRVPVPPTDDALRNWLERRAEACGFRLGVLTLIQPGYVYVNKSRDAGKGQRLRSVRYEGMLDVTDTNRFRDTLIEGIGPAKAFGFGLLSVAPVR